MSSKASKRRGRPIVVDGTKYYWKVQMQFGLAVVNVLLPTGRRLQVLDHEVTRSLEITPSAVAAFIRRLASTETS